MKVHIESGKNNNNNLKSLHDGKVHKTKHHSSPYKEEDNSAEIKEYLNKLQELVPFMPKNKELSNMEVISYVIDYIQDLSETLGLPPSPSSLPSSSSCDEDEDDFEMDEAKVEEVNSAKVSYSLINRKAIIPSKEDHVAINRSPLSVIGNQESKILERGE